MKQIIAITCLIFIYSITNAQINECKKIVELTVEAINEHSSAKIKDYLADDFTIAGMDGAMAKMVLDKLISQLNETVIDIKKTGEDENEFITLTYEIEYSRLGKKNAFFIFNKQNQLKELSLFKMEVKTMSGKSNIEKNTDSVTVVPFKKLGKLILVEANLNGVKRSFLLDNGAPKLVLNSKYSSSEIKAEKTLSSAQSVNGSISGMNIEKVKDFNFYGIKMENEDVLTMELSHLEKELNLEVYGLIGYEIIKDYDLLFDYENEKVYFLLPTFTNHFLENTYKNFKKEEVPLELDGHIPTIKLAIDEKILTVGIDCGAEANLLNEQLFASLEKQMIVGKKEDLRGADKSSKPVNAGTINNLKIGTRSFKNVFTVFNDMEHLNKNYKTKLDGLIGYEILSKQKTLVSFKNNKLIFID